MDIFGQPPSPQDFRKEYVERLRKFIVFVDSCLENRDLVKLNKELNRQTLYVLIQEGKKFDPEEFIGFIEPTSGKPLLKFGMNDSEESITNNRFKHHERKCLQHKNQQKT